MASETLYSVCGINMYKPSRFWYIQQCPHLQLRLLFRVYQGVIHSEALEKSLVKIQEESIRYIPKYQKAHL